MVKNKLTILSKRIKPEVHSEYRIERGVKKTEYQYLICDYCGDKIKLTMPKHERTGGIVELSYIITKSANIQLALCNKCVKKTIEEFEG